MNSIRQYEVPLQKYVAMMELEVPRILALINSLYFRVDGGIFLSQFA